MTTGEQSTDEFPTLLDILNQTEFWGRLAERVRVDDLTDNRLANVIDYLVRNAASLKFAYELDVLSVPGPNGDAASDCLDSSYSLLLAQTDIEWLEECPLMIRLRELQEERGI